MLIFILYYELVINYTTEGQIIRMHLADLDNKRIMTTIFQIHYL